MGASSSSGYGPIFVPPGYGAPPPPPPPLYGPGYGPAYGPGPGGKGFGDYGQGYGPGAGGKGFVVDFYHHGHGGKGPGEHHGQGYDYGGHGGHCGRKEPDEWEQDEDQHPQLQTGRLDIRDPALGKLSWLVSTTRGDLVYHVSVLARGQSSPQEVHERATRAVLRYLKTVVPQDRRKLLSALSRQEEKELKLHSYVDASWGSERSVTRRSISGGCLMLGTACIKTWARLQQSVAFSSAESELYALVEGAKEALGARCAVEHILGCDPVVPLLYCDSEAAVAISHAEGLRKLRHIDIRSCFLQQEVQSQSLRVVSVRGTDNPADIFTKNLDLASTLRHMHHIGLRSTLLPEGEKGLAMSILRFCIAEEGVFVEGTVSAQAGTKVAVCSKASRVDCDRFRRWHEEGDSKRSSRHREGSKGSRHEGFLLEFDAVHRRMPLPADASSEVWS